MSFVDSDAKKPDTPQVSEVIVAHHAQDLCCIIYHYTEELPSAGYGRERVEMLFLTY